MAVQCTETHLSAAVRRMAKTTGTVGNNQVKIRQIDYRSAKKVNRAIAKGCFLCYGPRLLSAHRRAAGAGSANIDIRYGAD